MNGLFHDSGLIFMPHSVLFIGCMRTVRQWNFTSHKFSTFRFSLCNLQQLFWLAVLPLSCVQEENTRGETRGNSSIKIWNTEKVILATSSSLISSIPGEGVVPSAHLQGSHPPTWRCHPYTLCFPWQLFEGWRLCAQPKESILRLMEAANNHLWFSVLRRARELCRAFVPWPREDLLSPCHHRRRWSPFWHCCIGRWGNRWDWAVCPCSWWHDESNCAGSRRNLYAHHFLPGSEWLF